MQKITVIIHDEGGWTYLFQDDGAYNKTVDDVATDTPARLLRLLLSRIPELRPAIEDLVLADVMKKLGEVGGTK